LHHQNLVQFIYNKNTLPKTLNSLVNINIKNKLTYELIKTITKLQNKFITSNNIQDLKYYSLNEILNEYKKKFNSKITTKTISTITNNTHFLDINNQSKKLSFLTPKKHFILFLKIKYILNLNPNASDKQIANYLEKIFSIKITSKKVFDIRKRYFIPNRLNRINELYLEYEKNFSNKLLLNYKNLKQFDNLSGVYELLSINLQKYNYKNSYTIYIGSTNNLKRRLSEYIKIKGHTRKLQDFLSTNLIYFRVITTKNYLNLEKEILNSFYKVFGQYPILNSNKLL